MPQDATVHLACLCAAWCRTCEGYGPVFERAAREAAAASAAHGGPPVRLHWVDIEDEAELVGALDIETFPTIVIADESHVRFAGPVTPEPETLARLLRARIDEATTGARWPAVAPEVEALAARLRDRSESP